MNGVTYLFLVGTSLKEGGVRDRIGDVRLQQVLPQTSGRLVGHLNAILKHGHWKLNRNMLHSKHYILQLLCDFEPC